MVVRCERPRLEMRDANRGGEPSTEPEPGPYGPGEEGFLGFVESARECSQRSPETRPAGGSLGLFCWPRVLAGGCDWRADPTSRSVRVDQARKTEERADP